MTDHVKVASVALSGRMLADICNVPAASVMVVALLADVTVIAVTKMSSSSPGSSPVVLQAVIMNIIKNNNEIIKPFGLMNLGNVDIVYLFSNSNDESKFLFESPSLYTYIYIL